MSRAAAVGGADRPPVVVHDGLAAVGGNDRLDGDDQAFGEALPLPPVAVIGHGWLFVDGPAHAVAAQRTDDPEPLPPHFGLDGLANLIDGAAGPSRSERLVERRLRRAAP